MKLKCVWEHNGSDTLLHCTNLVGAFARGESRERAIGKMEMEADAYLRWLGNLPPEGIEIEILQEKASDLDIRDADSDVLFDEERLPLTLPEYQKLKALALRSAENFQALYDTVPDKSISCLPCRRTFYGQVPRTAEEMYLHTKSVNAYYFGEIGVEADNDGTILSCRERGFTALEQDPDFLRKGVCEGSYGEEWSVRKVLRRFLWHDRIHARAMYRMAQKTFGENALSDVFRFYTKSNLSYTSSGQ